MKVDFFWLTAMVVALVASYSLYCNLRLSFETRSAEFRSIRNTLLMTMVMIAAGVCTGYAFDIKLNLRFLPLLVLVLPVIFAVHVLLYTKNEPGHWFYAIVGFLLLFLIGVIALSV